MSYDRYVAEKEEKLKNEVIAQNMKPDFEDFWKTEVEKMRRVPLKVKRTKLETPYDNTFLTYEISFNTHDDTIIDAYFCCPVHKQAEKLPCVAFYHGGGASKRSHAHIVATGVCCFAMDVRSQGGTSIDKADYEMGDTKGGLMSRDIIHKENFYMRNIYLDAVRAIDVISELPEVDASKIVALGTSQGGALSIVASALSGKVIRSFSAAPSYSCLKERVELGSGVFSATNMFLRKYPEYADEAFDTLSYFDINNMASLVKSPASVMLGLNDPICLPKFVYSIYDHINAPKEIFIMPLAQHEIAISYQKYVHGEFAKLLK